MKVAVFPLNNFLPEVRYLSVGGGGRNIHFRFFRHTYCHIRMHIASSPQQRKKFEIHVEITMYNLRHAQGSIMAAIRLHNINFQIQYTICNLPNTVYSFPHTDYKFPATMYTLHRNPPF